MFKKQNAREGIKTYRIITFVYHIQTNGLKNKMPERALRPFFIHCYDPSTSEILFKKQNAREGIKTELFPTVFHPLVRRLKNKMPERALRRLRVTTDIKPPAAV